MEKFLMLMMVVTLFTSCNQKKNELKENVAKFNDECPIPLGDIGSLNSVSYDGETVEMKMTSYETFATIPQLSAHTQELKESLCLSLTSNAGKKLIDAIIETGSNFKMVFVGNETRQRAEFTLSAQELSNARDKFGNMSDQEKLIASNLISSKIKLPFQVDNITKLVGLSLNQNELVYKFEINDRETGQELGTAINFLKSIVMSQIAHSFKGGMMGNRNRRFYQALVDCSQGAKYEYYEVNSGRSASFRLTVDEIRQILNGEWDNMPTAREWENFGNIIESYAAEEGDSTAVEIVDGYY